jgi:hypothetical protein
MINNVSVLGFNFGAKMLRSVNLYFIVHACMPSTHAFSSWLCMLLAGKPVLLRVNEKNARRREMKSFAAMHSQKPNKPKWQNQPTKSQRDYGRLLFPLLLVHRVCIYMWCWACGVGVHMGRKLTMRELWTGEPTNTNKKSFGNAECTTKRK